MKKYALAAFLLVTANALGGCVLGAAAGAGYMAHDEATENDGKFDPLEKVRGKDDGKN
ncbi:MAG TPA: hypothetical protein PLV61_15900 [Parvularculaceae bacterium]|nr:hypothetical protein [Amphiplicatus sp.]MCB9956434.1 hypothetical protein [Caulobacterales bacterium]HPE32677.1 hypothetical protein [Parvularculaceae bacterium]HRX38687.1 hypothetical protein [Parvularculaceae bacterium]